MYSHILQLKQPGNHKNSSALQLRTTVEFKRGTIFTDQSSNLTYNSGRLTTLIACGATYNMSA